MTDFTQDLFARRRNASDGNTRVVSAGRLWYDSITNSLRVSDGHTPGGQIVTGQSGAYTLPTATPSVKGGVQLGSNIIATGASIDVLQPTRVSQLENDSNYLSGSVLSGYATETYVTTRGYITSAALASGNANVIAANSRIQSISANLGAYQIWANANVTTLSSNAGTQATSINRLDANIGAFQTYANLHFGDTVYGDSNVTALLTGDVSTGPLTASRLTVNGVGGYFANISGYGRPQSGQQSWRFHVNTGIGGPDSWIEFPDGTFQRTAWEGSIDSLTNGSDTLSLNGAEEVLLPGGTASIYSTVDQISLYSDASGQNGLDIVNGGTSVLYSQNSVFIQTDTANLPVKNFEFTTAGSMVFPDNTTQTTAYPSTLSANVGTLFLGNISTQANLGAYQTWANGRITTIDANIGTLSLGNINIRSNLGAYQNWANSRITTLDANLGTATTNISNLVTQANANVAAYLTTYTGNVSAGNITVSNTGNVNVGNLSINRQATITFQPPTTTGAALTILAGNTKGGAGYNDFLAITNTSGGATAPSKWFRVNTTGELQIINSAYTSQLLVLSDAGDMSIAGNISQTGIRPGYSANRPGFRVFGATTNSWNTAVNTGGYMNSNQWTVDYNQGSYLNNSTGVFTAPVAGLYQVNLNARFAGNSTSISQACIIKNATSGNGGGGTISLMLEFAQSSTMNHAGVSTALSLAVNDTLVLKVTAGTIQFDSNDSWSVAYLG